jgi:adenine deaminase
MKACANQDRRRISDVALGNAPADTVITNGRLFNAFTREFIDGQSIWIKEGMIAYVGPDPSPAAGENTLYIDAGGMVLLPGLVEAHTHILSSRYGIEEFIRRVIPTGVTTVVTEALEFNVIVGKEGFDCVLNGLRNQPIRAYCTFPPMCCLTPAEEIHAITGKDIAARLDDPLCLGVGEIYWGNLLLEGNQGERLQELVALAWERGKVIEGHTAGASDKKLQAYACFGASSCHEPITEQEVLERLRLGFWVLIREGYIRKELDAVKGIFDKNIDFRRLALATDGVDAEGFLQSGYLDGSLRKALKLGVPPGVAYQMVTLNPAEHFRLDHLIGSLAPGKMADIVISPSPDEFSPRLVMCDGKILFRDGKTLVQPEKVEFPDSMLHSVRIGNTLLPLLPVTGRVRTIEQVTRLVTREKIVDLDDTEEIKHLNMVCALDRTEGEQLFMGYLKGFGLKEGAYGTTMCWDTRDLIVVGCDHQSMKTVVERLKTIGGGGVFAIGEQVVAEFRAPVCGIASLEPMETIRDQTRRLDDSLRQRGVPWEKPILTVDTLGTAAIPHLRINHDGYVNVRDRRVLPVEVS